MTATAESMRLMRDRRRRAAYREVRRSMPDARSEAVRRRVAEQSSQLKPLAETEATAWIEAVSEFDSDSAVTW